MRTDTPPAIVIDGLSKSYGSKRAVDGVSLTVPAGEFIGLVGPNGAGKSTLIEMIEGLRRPDAGTVTVLGLRPEPRNPALLPRIGVQTQQSAFFPSLTAIEHLRTVAALYGLGPDAAERALALVGLGESRDVRVTRVSGGQRQRLAIASAIVHDPEVVFLDEPTGALDPQARRDLWSLLRVFKGAGKTIVYTTHHLDEAEELCDRVAILNAGRLVAVDSPRDLVARAALGARLVLPAGRLEPDRARGLAGVDTVTVERDTLVLHTRELTRVLASLGATTDLSDVQTKSATLEDVYLDLIGAQS